MNLYEKINSVKSELIKEGVKKTGENKFSNYSYFELSEFMPAIIRKCEELKLFTVVSFSAELAKLTIINAEKPEERLEVLSPMSSASLKGCHEVQNLGAVQTYLRRYLYMAAFDIVCGDEIDSTPPIDRRQNNQPPQPKTIDFGKNPKTGQPFAEMETEKLLEIERAMDGKVQYAEYRKKIAAVLRQRGIE